MSRLLAALALLVVLAPAMLAADTKIKVTYVSDPPGATISEGGRIWGAAPLWLQYTAPGRFKACLRLNPVSIRWVSGAEVVVEGMEACPANGKNQQISVFRPKGLPGIEVDAQYAIALMQHRARDVTATPAWAAALDALGTELSRPRHCTQQVIGNQIFTTCSQ